MRMTDVIRVATVLLAFHGVRAACRRAGMEAPFQQVGRPARAGQVDPADRGAGRRPGPERRQRLRAGLSRDGPGPGLVPSRREGLGPARDRAGVPDRRGRRRGPRHRRRRLARPGLRRRLPERLRLVVAESRQGLAGRHALGAAHDQEVRQDAAPRPVHRRLQGHRASRSSRTGTRGPARSSSPISRPTRASVDEWPAEQVFTGSAGESPGKYAEGMSSHRHRRRRPARDPRGQSHVLL